MRGLWEGAAFTHRALLISPEFAVHGQREIQCWVSEDVAELRG
jgi:hypothetical protein